MISFKASFSLSSSAVNRRKQQFRNAQEYVDHEVLRLSEPFVPMRTGKLRQSGWYGTKLGSGVVRYTAPYAKPRYYKGRARNGKQGKFWFSRMKSGNKEKILNGTRRKFS